nr:DUF2971 domain-containing protein [Fodinibius halophilus]
MKNSADGSKHINIFAASFSENGDLLSQWRAYCPDSGGYNIGFNHSDLEWLLNSYNLEIVPCIYEEEKQFLLIDELINHFLTKYQNDQISDWMDFLDDFKSEFIRLAPVLKHPSFREEKEWRIVSRPVSYYNEEVDYRPGESMIIPYYKMRLASSDDNFSFHKINIGPTPHKKLAEHSVMGLLFKSGHFNSTANHQMIDKSKIPYRTW